MHSRGRLSALVLLATTTALALTACGSADSSATPSTATQDAGVSADFVALTFELDGTTHTIVGSVGGGLRSCNDRFVTVAKKEFPDAGVQLGLIEDSARANVAAWAVGDYAVQFLGEGDIERSDADSTISGSNVTGTATVRAVPSGTTPRLNDLNMPGGERVEATATFSIDCSAS